MKYSILLLSLVSQIAVANCNVKTASYLANEHQVGPITNLVKDQGEGYCNVAFDITVDGTQHHLTKKYKGLERSEILCQYARDEAREDLLLDLGGTFKAEAVTSCNEGAIVPVKITVGSTVLETEIGKHKRSKYFTRNGLKCRMFTEHGYVDGTPRVYNGVICQNDPEDSNWTVMDKWQVDIEFS